jgi:hypothetical protein
MAGGCRGCPLRAAAYCGLLYFSGPRWPTVHRFQCNSATVAWPLLRRNFTNCSPSNRLRHELVCEARGNRQHYSISIKEIISGT